jgi:hypothetical protein
MKQTILLILTVTFLICTSCKKDKNSSSDITASLKNTEWYGLFRNKTESFNRGYAIAINNDVSFTFFSGTVTLYGKWSVNGNTIRFKFDAGAANEWEATVDNNSLKNFTVPVPDNFSFFNNATKITGTTPSGYIGHVWTAVGTPPSQLKLLANGIILDGGSGSYTGPAFSNKIFKVADATGNIIVFVDGNIAWVSFVDNINAISTWRQYNY